MKHRIAIIGLGGMGTWHLNELETMDAPEVAGIWDIKEERRAYARSRNVFVYDSLDALLADESVDLVLIATPNDLHRPLAIQAMEAGKNVICEKPVTINSADLQTMMEASERTGKFLTVHQNRRWDEDFLTIKEILAEGKLGPVFRIESRVHGAHGIPGDWRQEPEKGGGMILDWGVHLLDQVLLLYPDAKVETVYATTELTSMHMVVAIIPAPISVSVVWWAVRAVAVTATVMLLLIGAPGHIDTGDCPKQSGKESGAFWGWTVIACRYVDFLQRLIFFKLLRFLFTQIFRQRKMLLLA